ncbi:protein O-mannosyltransferase 1 [Galendromus occidentalis]|uniref:Protein O-mannosyltransferase 1 n=1 Tax=Galendromus occidentalis TaxID=34638 RepID=A0AAJ6QY09_9ACAR|nr:protein O-mannosyltransferase 1 [Galendromus occidentalis]
MAGGGGEVRKRKNAPISTQSVDSTVGEASPEVSSSSDDLPAPEKRKDEGLFFTSKRNLFSIRITLDGPSIGLFVLALAMRLYRLEFPRSVVFDELHFVKYASLYASNTFFFDSQPPLGKQIISMVAYLCGFRNSQLDRIGGEYPAEVPVFALRLVPALFGSLLIPLCYKICLLLGFSQPSATLAGVLLLTDTALLTQSRFVLMEAILIFFAMLGLFCTLKFRQLPRNEVFGPAWWTFLIGAAASYGFALCVKNVGALSLLLGIYILLRDLWEMLSDRSVTDQMLAIHTLIRAAVITIVPLSIYIGVFYIHLSILTKAGPHDTIMTSGFQASLEGGLASITKGQPSYIAHGSQITLRHSLGRTCWLHSHNEVYPLRYPDGRGSSHQQQVTCYSYKDVNNWWIVKRPGMNELVVDEPIDRIKHGDVVEFVHGITMRLLNSHDVASPLSPALQEVSCYIDYNITRFPPHTQWRVEILNRDAIGDYWATIHSQVRFIHVDSGQALKFSGKQLPDWGFNQHEIVTDRVIDQDDTIWNVEEHRYTKKKDDKERELDMVTAEFVPLEPTRLSFWQKFAELQYKMLIADNENVEDHMFASSPVEWPFLLRGVAYWISPDSNAQIFLLGNPILWWTGSLAVPSFASVLLILLLRRRRMCYDIPEDMFRSVFLITEVLVGGFLIHYLPYFFCDRSLFLHHYLPAAVFKPLLIAALIQFVDQILSTLVPTRYSWMRRSFYVGVFSWLVVVIWAAFHFTTFAYGGQALSAQELERLRWLESWQFIIHKK